MLSIYNSNPKDKKVGDCVIRAVSKAMGMTWEDTYVALCIQGFLSCDMPSANSVWGTYLKNHGFRREIVSDDCPECYTVADFAREYPQGVYVVGTGSHAIAVIDGVIYDAWDSTREQPIYYYYKGE